MKFYSSIAVVFAGLGLMALTSCAGGTKQATAESSPAASAPVETSPIANSPTAESSAMAKTDSQAGQGKQVIESGPYHLEFVPAAAANGTHLDFFLQRGDSHEAIADAKVAAQVQLPDGTQQSLDMDYDASGKHYTVLLPATATGEYKVAVLSDIGGEKVNGRFTFTK